MTVWLVCTGREETCEAPALDKDLPDVIQAEFPLKGTWMLVPEVSE